MKANDGTGGGIEITPSNAKEGIEISPVNAKPPMAFDKTGNTTPPPEKGKGPSDNAWWKKNSGIGYETY